MQIVKSFVMVFFLFDTNIAWNFFRFASTVIYFKPIYGGLRFFNEYAN